MATSSTAKRTPKKPVPKVKEKEKKLPLYTWVAVDRTGRRANGETRAAGDAAIKTALRKQGYSKIVVKKQKIKRSRKITDKDMTLFTRQLATMLRSGVPLLQALDIVGKGHDNPSVGNLLNTIKGDIEVGNTLTDALRKHPKYFDSLYCNLVGAGEAAGILEAVLDRLAVYKEKILAVKSKIKAALFYPTAIMVVAFIIVAVIMIWVIPAFKELFSSFGADLPAPTKIVMNMSDGFVEYWWLIFGTIGAVFVTVKKIFNSSVHVRNQYQRLLLKAPVFGDLVYKGSLARWSRTLATMFAAGVPLVEALESVGGASGHITFEEATDEIRRKVEVGNTLTQSLIEAGIFPNMLVQMTQIGEEAGALDAMLNKVADFYEAEVDDAVAALASLMEPLIMAFLGVIIGGLVVAVYLPIFKMGSVAG